MCRAAERARKRKKITQTHIWRRNILYALEFISCVLHSQNTQQKGVHEFSASTSSISFRLFRFPSPPAKSNLQVQNIRTKSYWAINTSYRSKIPFAIFFSRISMSFSTYFQQFITSCVLHKTFHQFLHQQF